jgi:hypothetical protein
MTTFNENQFPIRKEKLSKDKCLYSKLESTKIHLNHTKILDENNIKSLSTENANTLNNLELDISWTKFSNEIDAVDKTGAKDIQNLLFNQIPDKSRFSLDNEIKQMNDHYNDYLKPVQSENKQFEQYNNSICKEINDSVNFLKSKLFTLHKEEIIPVKKKYISSHKTYQPHQDVFYGLPYRVKELIKNIKGIDKLYGKILFVRYF